MAKSTPSGATDAASARSLMGRLWRLAWWLALRVGLAVLLLILAFSVLNPPTTPYMLSESRRLGGVDHSWTDLDQMTPDLWAAAIAAEDANYCLHWGFDMTAIRAALAEGGGRGASTISQQLVKNMLLWQGRSWPRKALEALLTPIVELTWSKRRMMEVYLNIIEFDEGVFGVGAAARHYFNTTPDQLSAVQAARLAMVLPNPKGRNAAKPTAGQRARTRAILDGAATVQADGRAACVGG